MILNYELSFALRSFPSFILLSNGRNKEETFVI